MPRRPRIFLTVVWAIAFVLRGSLAGAVCVGPVTPCREFSRTPLVFQGVVERITALDEYEGPPFGPLPSRLARVRVERSWKGLDKTTTVDLLMLGQPEKNWVEDEVEFKVGERYIVWAYPSSLPNVWHASGCSLTRPLKDAADQVAYLDGRATSGSEGYVYGTVYLSERSLGASPRSGGPEGATVALDGQGLHREVRVDATGRYTFTGLPPGRFEVRVVPAPTQTASRGDVDPRSPDHEMPLQRTASITGPHDCDQVDFWVQSNGRISGFIEASDGQTPGGILVQAAPVDEIGKQDAVRAQGKFSFLSAARAITKPDGYFEMPNMPPGRFAVGVTLDQRPSADSPFPRTFLPGVPSLEEATVVELQRGQQLSIGSLKLPPRLHAVSVPGVVTDADGRPAADVFINAYNNWRMVAASTRSDKDGKFVLSLYAGYTYRVRATLSGKTGIVIGQWTQEIGAPDGVDVPLRIVLTPPISK